MKPLIKLKNALAKWYRSWVPKPIRWFMRGCWVVIIFFWRPTWFNIRRYKSLGILGKLSSVLYTFGYVVVCFLLALEINLFWLFGYLPSMHDVRNPKVPLITEVYAMDGQQLGTISIERRIPVEFEDIDSNTINALIATEDIRFYEHHGLDLKAIVSATFSTLHGNKRGGSTITNQLVKNVYRTRHRASRGILGRIPLVGTLVAKIKEWVTALKIELVYTKEQILTIYLNAVEYGNHTFGIKNASNFYFQKEPLELTVAESALLIGVLKGTSYYNPRRQPERALQRRNVVLGQMVKYRFIDSLDFVKYSNQELHLNIAEGNQEPGSYFMEAVKRELSEWCDKNNYNLYTDGLKITTTLNPKMQRYAEMAVRESMRYIQQAFNAGHYGYRTWFDKQIREELKQLNIERPAFNGDLEANPLTPTEVRLISIIKNTSHYKSCLRNGMSEQESMDKMFQSHSTELLMDGLVKKVNLSTSDSVKHMLQLLQCGLISIEAHTGAVRAWVGGISHEFFKFDHVEQSVRQAGSTFKPFVYAAALVQGVSPCTTMVDEAVEFVVQENGRNKLYSPSNSDKIFSKQYMTLRRALAISKNSIAVKLIHEVGAEEVVDLAKQMGIRTDLEPNLSLALGSEEVRLRELTQAYSVFVNGGTYIPERLITSIANYEGELIEQFDPKVSHRVMDEKLAYAMTYFLQGSVEEKGGTSRRLFTYGLPYRSEIGGKTGTSNDYADGWFVGITPELITGVWVGGDDRRIRFKNANGQGGRTALPIFGRYMQLVLGDGSLNYTGGHFPIPDGGRDNMDCYSFNRNLRIPEKVDDGALRSDTIEIEIDSNELIKLDALREADEAGDLIE